MSTPSLRETARHIVQRLHDAGFDAFWVGGCVRDYLLGRDPVDYDLVTSALPEQVETLFQRTVAVGRKFGVMVVLEGEHEFQVATFRAESDYQDGRHPEKVTFGDAPADAERRDFTVNGLFYDPVGEKLHDWVGGEADLRAKVIRTIGVPAERFAEDHLRLLRAVRFAAQLGFDIEKETFAAIQANAPKIKSISAERVRDELIKLFAPPSRIADVPSDPSRAHQRADREIGAPAARGLDLLRESGLLEHVLPELEATIRCEQSPDYHPEGSVFNHVRLMLSKLPPNANPSLPWAAILHDIAKPVTASRDPETGSIHFYEHERIGADMAAQILERLRFPRKQIDDIVQAVRCHMQFKDAPNMRKSTLRRMLLRPTFPLELELHKLDCLGSHRRLDIYDFLVEQARELDHRPEIHPPLLTGNDLIEMGVRTGPDLGALLNEIREKQLQEELTNTEEARAWVKKHLRNLPHAKDAKNAKEK